MATLARAEADEAGAAAADGSGQGAEGGLDASETDLGKAVIRSPINGVVVLTRSVEPGQTVAASLQAPVLFTLAEDLAQMELHVYVDEADVGRVKEGQPATFTVDAYPNRIFQARIAQVRYGSKTVSGVVTYETVLTLDNADLSLRPGMTATAVITVQKVENGVLVPNAALRFCAVGGTAADIRQQRRAPAEDPPGPATRAAQDARGTRTATPSSRGCGRCGMDSLSPFRSRSARPTGS